LRGETMKRHFKYLSYVIRHKWFVFRAGLMTGAPLWRLIIHDWSKFLPSEWFPYVHYFHQTKDEKWNEWADANTRYGCAEAAPHGHFASERFSVAWLHHQNRQPHHWQYWCLIQDDGQVAALPMPEKFVREMVADWAGAGRAITGKWEVMQWYKENKHIMKMHPDTRALTEKVLDQNFSTEANRLRMSLGMPPI